MGYVTSNNLGFNYNTFGMQFNYRRVSQDYQSLGVPNIGTNTQSASITSNISLLNSKMNLSGFFSRSNDNLSKKQIMTTNTNTFGMNLNYNISERFNIDGGYNGTLVSQDPIASDTLFSTFGLDNHSFNFNPAYTISGVKYDHRFSLPFDYFTSKSENTQMNYISTSSSFTLSPTYSLTITDLDLNTGATYSFSNSKSDNFQTDRHSIGVYANKAFLSKKELSINVSGNYGIDSYENTNNSNINLSGGVNYRLFEQHNFSLNVSYSTGSQSSYYNFRGYFSYQWGIPPLSTWGKKKETKK